MFKKTLNVHPSLLPKYRGGAPIQHTILNGDTETGVSIIDISPDKFDAGRIYKQTRMEVPPKAFYGGLKDMLSGRAAEDMIDVLRNLDMYSEKSYVQQGKGKFAKKITKKDACIDWSGMDAEDIYTRYRAFGELIPLYCYFQGKMTSIGSFEDPMLIQGAMPEMPPGSMYYDSKMGSLYVSCRDGTWIKCSDIKVSGKRSLNGRDFVNGYNLINQPRKFDSN
jgi:methionyl-tRNA formyltransferase